MSFIGEVAQPVNSTRNTSRRGRVTFITWQLINDTLAALRSNFDGEPWHGRSLRTILMDVDPANVHAHPIPKAKSIAELVAHVIAWMEIVERRVHGEEFEITTEMDFPDTTNVTWADLLARVDAAQARLIQTISGLEDKDLARQVSLGKQIREDHAQRADAPQHVSRRADRAAQQGLTK